MLAAGRVSGDLSDLIASAHVAGAAKLESDAEDAKAGYDDPASVSEGGALLSRARSGLFDEFPHLHAEIDVLLTGLNDGEAVRIRPTLLVGEPGGGKSRLVRRLAEALNVPLHRFDGTGSSDNAFGGTPRRWSSGEHAAPLEAVRRYEVANPWVMIDEIDKAGDSRHNGSLDRAVLPFLEPENARAYPDPYVQSTVDLSHVGYLLTANTDAMLPGR
jgi:ATP-dependent Lon protease